MEEDIDLETGHLPETVLQSRLKYGTGMRINAALKILAEKRLKRQERKRQALYHHYKLILVHSTHTKKHFTVVSNKYQTMRKQYSPLQLQ